MKIIKQEMRPIGYCTIELSEAEIQSIIGCVEELQMYKNRSLDDVMGIRKEIYKTLQGILSENGVRIKN